jgi:molecular chaperone DnaK (HSP70)
MSTQQTALQSLPPGQFAIGLSLGTDSCVVAAASAATNGRIDVCFNDVGDRVTPTYVAFSSGEVHAGLPAKQTLVRQPMQTVPHVLAMLTPQIAAKLRVACEVSINESDDTVTFPNIDPDNGEDESADGTARYDAVKILTIFLTKVKETVINAVCAGSSQSIGSVVIAVPRFVSSLTAVRNIAIEAGLGGSSPSDNTVHVIYDDSAAVLAAGFCSTTTSGAPPSPSALQWVLVLDWGALNFSASFWELAGREQLPRRLGHVQRFNAVAGRKLDEEVALQIAQGFQRKTKMDAMENARSKRKLLQAAEGVKKTLSATNTTSAEIEAFFEGIDLKEAFSRVKLESIIREKKYVEFAESAVAELLDTVSEDHFYADPAGLLTLLSNVTVTTQGGMFRIPVIGPAVQQMLASLFRSRSSQAALKVGETFHSDPAAAFALKQAPDLPGISSDEQAAAGACVQALLSLPRLSLNSAASGRSAPDAANRDLHAAGGNTINSPSVLLRNIYLLVGVSEPWAASGFESKKCNGNESCYTFNGEELAVVAVQGLPLPHEVELQFAPGGASWCPSLVFFQEASATALQVAGAVDEKKGTVSVVPLLSSPIPCPAAASAVFVMFDADDHIRLRFVAADGSACSAGEFCMAVQGGVE